MHGLSSRPTGAASSTGKSPRASTTTRTTSRARPPSRCRPPDAGGAGRIADQDGTGWSTLALRGTWRPKAATARTSSTSAINSTPTSCGRSSRTPPTGSTAPATTRFSAFRRQHSAAEHLRAGHLALLPTTGARRSACASSAGRRTTAPLSNATSTLDVRRTHRDQCLAQGRARLATDARVGAEGVGRARRAHADGVRALPGFDLRQRDREQRSRTSSRKSPGPASSPPSASSAPACCEPPTSTRTRATRCIRRPT